MTSKTSERVTVPPITCQPWCKRADGHPNETSRADQWCSSDELRVDLTLHPEIPENDFDPETGKWLPSPDYLETYLMQDVDGPLKVCVSHAGGPEIAMTPAEARQVIEALQLVLGQVGDA